MFWFVRQFIRRNFNPIPEDKARRWDRRLRRIYLFCAWNALGIMIYYHFNHEKDATDKNGELGSMSLGWAKGINMDKAHVIRIQGISSVTMTKPEANVEKPLEEEAVEEVVTTPTTN